MAGWIAELDRMDRRLHDEGVEAGARIRAVAHFADMLAKARKAKRADGPANSPQAMPDSSGCRRWVSRQDVNLFSTGFAQVFLVATNVVCIAAGNYSLAFLTSLGLSYVWTRNVSRVAIGIERDRWLYAAGAGSGCATGMALARFLSEIAA